MARTGSCPSCGADTPDWARFCPHCGSRLERGSTEVIEGPPEETGPVPVHTESVEPHLFGVTPPIAVFALALAALAVGVLLLVLDAALAGAIVLAVGLVLLALFFQVARRKPDSRFARAAASTAGSVRSRVGHAAGSAATRARIRRELARGRAELARLKWRRRELLLALGGAAYEGDDTATDAVRELLAELDRTYTAKEEEIAAVVAQARAQLRRARLEVQSTEMVELPDEGCAPAPASGEASPPEPARIPEPYPAPDEGDRPEPARIPEPYPPPDEGDRPEPARIPEPEPGGEEGR